MLIAIVTSLTKLMDKLPSASRYGMQLFWLALSLVRLVPLPLFNCTALFLDAIVSNLAGSGDFKDGHMVTTLLQGRLPLQDAALQLDEIYGIHFNVENFHFAVLACLVKGLTDSVTRATAIRVLTSFLEVTSFSTPSGLRFPRDLTCLPYLGILLARAMTPEEVKDNFWIAGWAPAEDKMSSEEVYRMIVAVSVKDKELLLNLAIGLVDFHYLEESVQNRSLSWLNRVALKRPNVVLHL
jgi:neurofibromin 1